MTSEMAFVTMRARIHSPKDSAAGNISMRMASQINSGYQNTCPNPSKRLNPVSAVR